MSKIIIDEDKCVGCGVCASHCHEGAIKVVDGKAKVVESKCDQMGRCIGQCPYGAISFEDEKSSAVPSVSEIRQWPLQLTLLNPAASFFQNADLLVAADCTSFAFKKFHDRFLKNRVAVIFCPKLDSDIEGYIEKLTEIIADNDIRSITVVKMEVPCCMGALRITEEALRRSGKNIILKEYTVSVKGELV